MQPVAGVTVTVTAFQFAGNTLLSNTELAPVVAEYLNRPISFAELQKAAAAVAEAYRKAGWVVRAYLWGAAVLLRGLIDAGDYKQFIFPLLFFKRISDIWEEEYQAALADTGGDLAMKVMPA